MRSKDKATLSLLINWTNKLNTAGVQECSKKVIEMTYSRI